MSIELTPEERANQRKKQEMAQALETWKKGLAEKIAQDTITKRNVTNPRKVKAYKKGAKQEARKILKALDNGMIF
jgi:hypothetical protein